MKYTKEQLEKIDFGKFKHHGFTAVRHGTAIALFSGEECLAVKLRNGWNFDANFGAGSFATADATDAVDAFVKSELERIMKQSESSTERSYTWPVELDGEMFMVTLAKVKP